MSEQESRRAPDPRRAPRPSTHLRAVLGVLLDGTPHYVPVGQVRVESEAVCCHLCGGWFRSVAAHLPAHGWTRQAYADAFGLQQGAALECLDTRARRAEALRARRLFEPAVRDGVATGQAMARSGELAEHAAKAARGRPHPAARRPTTLAALARVDPLTRAAANRRRRRAELLATAADAARRTGFPTFEAYVADSLGRGRSLAATSVAAGLQRDWLSRHLDDVAPGLGQPRRTSSPPPGRAQVRLVEAVARLGGEDVAAWLRRRHHDENATVRAIAAELGVPRATVGTALDHHGVARVPHAARRGDAARTEAEVAERLGTTDLRGALRERRARGQSWSAIADEVGVTPTWLRRHATVGSTS